MKNTRAILLLVIVASFGGAVVATTLQQRAVAARNSSGTYTLPSGNPVTTKTTITSNWANTTLSDIGAELTNSLDRAGRGAMTAPLQLASGTIAAPAISFSSEPSSGLYRAGAGDLRMSVASTDVEKYASTGVTMPAGLTVTTASAIGITATGNGASSGIRGNGGSASGIGVHGVGGATNGIGVTGEGSGTGAGASFTGGPTGGAGVAGAGGTSAGSGVTGTGGSSSGVGGSFTGGASNGAGVLGTGTGTGIGVSGTGGSGDGNGGRFVGGATNGIGLVAIGTGTGVAIQTQSGGLQIGTGGAAITASYAASYTSQTATCTAGVTADVGAQTLTGVAVGGVCTASLDAFNGNGVASCAVTASNTIHLVFHCSSTGSITGLNYRVRVFQP